MSISATANSKVSIGTTEVFAAAEDFATDTYVRVLGVEDLGEFGSEAEILVAKRVDSEYTHKVKGSRDNGTLQLVVFRDPADAGQTALRAAEGTSFRYNFKVELNDKPNPTGTNTIFYFSAIVAAAKNSYGGADDIVKTTFSLAISGKIYEVPATAGA